MSRVTIIEPNITEEQNEENLERVIEVLESITHGTVVITHDKRK
ncbi:hypothetical protein [Clostridium peptidivorans]|nr:hypothetical protein [Clostridium peptidivorans]